MRGLAHTILFALILPLALPIACGDSDDRGSASPRSDDTPVPRVTRVASAADRCCNTVSGDSVQALLEFSPIVFIGTAESMRSVMEPVFLTPFPTPTFDTNAPTPVYPKPTVTGYPGDDYFSYTRLTVETVFSPHLQVGDSVELFQSGGRFTQEDGSVLAMTSEGDVLLEEGRRYLIFALWSPWREGAVEAVPWGKFVIVDGVVRPAADDWISLGAVIALDGRAEADLDAIFADPTGFTPSVVPSETPSVVTSP